MCRVFQITSGAIPQKVKALVSSLRQYGLLKIYDSCGEVHEINSVLRSNAIHAKYFETFGL